MSEKLIVESRVKELLLAATKAKSVGQEVLDFLSSEVRDSANQCLKDFARLTPGGRLLLLEEDLSLGARQARSAFVDPQPTQLRPLPERLCSRAKLTLQDNGGERRGFPVAEDEMDAYADWKYECSNGDTLLGFREWQEHKAEDLENMVRIEQADKAARSAP